MAFILCMLIAPYTLPSYASQESVEQKVVVLLVEFPDVKLDRTVEEIRSVLYEVDEIFRQASFNKFSINFAVSDKLVVPNNLQHYSRGEFDNMRFINDVMPIAVANANTGFDDSWVLIFHAGKTTPTGNAIYRQMAVDGGTVLGFARVDATPFTVAVTVHELAHLFGRLPDLYDTSRPVDDIRDHYQSDIFYYDLDIMGAKTHGGFSAYSRIKMGFLDDHVLVINPVEERTVTLAPLESCESGICALKIPIDNVRYYLIEFREVVRDQNPILHPVFEGLVITYIDESIPSGRGPVKLLNINGYSTEFMNVHVYSDDSIFVSPEHGFMISHVNHTVHVRKAESVQYYSPSDVAIHVTDFLGRKQKGISIDVSKDDYIVARLRTDQNGLATFSALQPGTYAITVGDCFRCVGSKPMATVDALDGEIRLVINEFMFHIAISLVGVVVAGIIIGLLLLRKSEREARERLQAEMSNNATYGTTLNYSLFSYQN